LQQAYQTGLILRGDRRVLPQGVAHQPRVCAAQHAATLGDKNRLMPRELAASVLPALRPELISAVYRAIHAISIGIRISQMVACSTLLV
jgi:hypothetical protein